MKPGAEGGDDLRHVLGEVVREGRVLAPIHDDDLGLLSGADRKDQPGAEAQQSILVCDHQAFDLARGDAVEQPREALLVAVLARPEIDLNIADPALARAVKLECLLPTLQVSLLIVRRDPREATVLRSTFRET